MAIAESAGQFIAVYLLASLKSLALARNKSRRLSGGSARNFIDFMPRMPWMGQTKLQSPMHASRLTKKCFICRDSATCPFCYDMLALPAAFAPSVPPSLNGENVMACLIVPRFLYVGIVQHRKLGMAEGLDEGCGNIAVAVRKYGIEVHGTARDASLAARLA